MSLASISFSSLPQYFVADNFRTAKTQVQVCKRSFLVTIGDFIFHENKYERSAHLNELANTAIIMNCLGEAIQLIGYHSCLDLQKHTQCDAIHHITVSILRRNFSYLSSTYVKVYKKHSGKVNYSSIQELSKKLQQRLESRAFQIGLSLKHGK